MGKEKGAKVAAVIAAAGRGSRFGSSGPKALVLLGGEPLVVHAVRAMRRSDVVDSIVVVAPENTEDFLAVEKVFSDAEDVCVVRGGASRQASVAQGLAAVGQADYVLIHDAARPLVPEAVIRRVVEVLQAGYPAVVPALPVVDTVKSVARGTSVNSPGEKAEESFADGRELKGGKGKIQVELVEKTLDRSALRAMQTPQGFDFSLILKAHDEAQELGKTEEHSAPDDAALMEEAGVDVVLVEGSQRALKITLPTDLSIAELFLSSDF